MATFEITLVVNRPIDEMFAFLSNAENLPRWRASMLKVTKISSGPPGMGSLFNGHFTFLGRPFDGEIEVIAYEPHSHYTTRMKNGPFPLETGYRLESVDGGTRLVMLVNGTPGGFFKLAESLVVSMAKRSFETDLRNLKEMLEVQAI